MATLEKHYSEIIDIGLPVEDLQQPLRICMTEEPQAIEVPLAATNRRGKAILCKVTCTPLSGSRKEIQGAVMLMEQVAEG